MNSVAFQTKFIHRQLTTHYYSGNNFQLFYGVKTTASRYSVKI